MAIGVGIAVALCLSQTRYVRLVSIIPPSPQPSIPKGQKTARIFLQGAHNWKKNGLAFPLDKCSIQSGRDHSEIIMRVQGERGHWFIPVDEAMLHGQKMDTWNARDEFVKEWTRFRGRKTGQWPAASPADFDRRWRSGPIVEK